MAFKGDIQIKKGIYGAETTRMSNLLENQEVRPVIRNFLEHADKRSLTTLLTSGMVGPYGVGYVDTKIGKVDNSKKIGSLGYQFDVMGRIQLPVTVNHQVGATLSDGTFKLSCRENYGWPGATCLFPGAGFQARQMGNPTGGDGNWIYTFKSIDGTAFVAATHLGSEAVKTFFPAASTYGEQSKRGYGRSFFPDAFVVHMTTQRKTIGISGDAATQILWYEYTNEAGTSRGWRFEAEQQNKAAFTMENEWMKWDGKSTMKNDDGTLRTRSRIQDEETGLDIVAGDGVLEQIYGGNELFGSGVNGYATSDDFSDALATIRKKSNHVEGNVIVFVTGDDGMRNAQREMAALTGHQNVQLVQIVNQEMKTGGAKVGVGFNFIQYNVDGDTVYFVRHPMFDDAQRYPAKGSDGKLIRSGMYVGLTMEVEGKKNVEILSKGEYGIDRSMLEVYLNGLTGIKSGGAVISEEDAIKYAMFRQDLLVIYNTRACIIIHKTA